MREIKSLHQFRVSNDQSVIEYITDISSAQNSIASIRLEILSEVERCLGDGGAKQPLETMSNLMSCISSYEYSIKRLFEDNPEIAKMYFDESPVGFDCDTIFAILELIKFLNEIERLLNTVNMFEYRAEMITLLRR